MITFAYCLASAALGLILGALTVGRRANRKLAAQREKSSRVLTRLLTGERDA